MRDMMQSITCGLEKFSSPQGVACALSRLLQGGMHPRPHLEDLFRLFARRLRVRESLLRALIWRQLVKDRKRGANAQFTASQRAQSFPWTAGSWILSEGGLVLPLQIQVDFRCWQNLTVH